jgi:hypothetical protein
MASSSDSPPFDGTIPLVLSVLGTVCAFVAVGSFLFWIDPAGTTASCAGAEACISGKAGLFKIEFFGGGVAASVLLTLGILGILKKPSAH